MHVYIRSFKVESYGNNSMLLTLSSSCIRS